MKPPKFAEIDIRATPWIVVTGRPEWKNSLVEAYRVWKASNGWEWLQCHEWRYKDGRIWEERWIKSTIGFHSDMVPTELDK